MTTEIDRSIFNGRMLRGHEDRDGDQVVGWPEAAYESVRAINHLTCNGLPIPAPVVFDVLGNLKGVGHLLPQALRQLTAGLVASSEAFDVYDHNDEPSESVAKAREAMLAAVVHELDRIAPARVGEEHDRVLDDPGEVEAHLHPNRPLGSVDDPGEVEAHLHPNRPLGSVDDLDARSTSACRARRDPR
jgi:hypothetical protein